MLYHRITPAYAGKSLPLLSSMCISEDHPRLCGEKGSSVPGGDCFWGSPPPMRGKGELPCPVNGLNGITPAYAGKSFFDDPPKSLFEDHPRLCGEKANLLGVTTDYLGSPPPMRGKDKITLSVFIFKRITPAYAGKRRSAFSRSAFSRDHPRLCGEKLNFPSTRSITSGSPPPMRGKVSGKLSYSGCSRITPAYAGKSHGSGDCDEGR